MGSGSAAFPGFGCLLRKKDEGYFYKITGDEHLIDLANLEQFFTTDEKVE